MNGGCRRTVVSWQSWLDRPISQSGGPHHASTVPRRLRTVPPAGRRCATPPRRYISWFLLLALRPAAVRRHVAIAPAGCERHLRAIGGAHPAHDLAHMDLDGAFTDIEPPRDRLVRFATAQQLEHRLLAFGEPVRGRVLANIRGCVRCRGDARPCRPPVRSSLTGVHLPYREPTLPERRCLAWPAGGKYDPPLKMNDSACSASCGVGSGVR